MITAGSAAEHTRVGCLNFTFMIPEESCPSKQAGRGGIGTVFRDKKIKGVLVRFKGTKGNLNNPHDISLINKAGVRLHREIALYDHSKTT